MNNNDKLITKAIYKIKGKPHKQLYNYFKFGEPINQKLSEGILKRRSRSYSGHKFSTKFKFCKRCFSFKNIERHHQNYNNPNNIIFLCKKCHLNLHKQ